MEKPLRKSVRWPGPDGDLEVTVYFLPIEGRMESVGFDVRSFRWTESNTPRKLPGTEPRTVRTEDLRTLRLAEIIDEARSALRAFALADTGEAEWDELPWAAEQVEQWEPRRGRPRLYPLEHFAEVARVYREAYGRNLAPTRAVAHHFSVSDSTAAKWVARCRSPELGLLPETTRGRARVVPKKNPRRKR